MDLDIPPALQFVDQKPKGVTPSETVFDDKTGLPLELLSEIEDYKKDRIEKFNKDLGFLKEWISKIFKSTPKFPVNHDKYAEKDSETCRCCPHAVNIITTNLYSKGYTFKYNYGVRFDDDFAAYEHSITIDLI